MTHTILQKPSVELVPSFLAFVEALRRNGDPVWEPYVPQSGESDDEFVRRLQARESSPRPPFVPESIFWGVQKGQVVGRISLRHRLEGLLKKIGGHIGYEVHPAFRNQGIAKEMLRQVLKEAHSLKIEKVLLTCSPQNLASNRTIQACGGIYAGKVHVDTIREDRNHYWIELGPEALQIRLEHIVESSSENFVILASKDNRAMGSLTLTKNALKVSIKNLVVDPGQIRQGYGRALLQYSFNLFPTCEFQVEINADDNPSLQFYRSFGFVIEKPGSQETGPEKLSMTMSPIGK